MYKEEEFEEISTAVFLVDYSPGYKLGEFDCGLKDYNDFITNDARIYIEQNICQVKLLLCKQTANIVAYMALNTDSFILDPEEKKKENLDIPFNSVPALKIGKLATSSSYKDKPYGSFMLSLALGYLEQLNDLGIGCRFLVVDADIEHDARVPEFYEKNGFVYNEKYQKRGKSKSMRYDVFED